MALFGLAITLRGLRLSGEAVKLRSLRPVLLVCAGVLAFAFLVQPFGLILAVLALVFISCLGGWEFRLREVVALSFVLAALVAGVFVYALGLPFNIFWTR